MDTNSGYNLKVNLTLLTHNITHTHCDTHTHTYWMNEVYLHHNNNLCTCSNREGQHTCVWVASFSSVSEGFSVTMKPHKKHAKVHLGRQSCSFDVNVSEVDLN